ncbi:unnamed protein product [Caenorhabditis angaria]|uniref:DEP domain-containing protein n=1 Tax=Caenorhabditis angaria TaxID=860376 RepID=A0A9P1MVX7_9PELO|nr:unnamed protein product [Caenorhabditis angaria]
MENDEYYDKFPATQMFDKIVWHFRSNMPLKTNQKYIVTSVKNSFSGKDAVDFLTEEMPKIVPDKPTNRSNIKKLVEMMYDSKIIIEPMSMKSQEVIESCKGFRENRIYIFGKTLEELRQPTKRSRRSASFNGVRKSIQTTQDNTKKSPVAPQEIRKIRRLSRSNGNLAKLESSIGHENKGFDENLSDPLNIRDIDFNKKEPLYEKKDKNYDWLPFFKSKRFQTKQEQKVPKRSVSLDRNHVNLLGSPSKALSPIPKASDDCVVVLHPTGEVPKLSKNISRSKLYESIARRQQTPTQQSVPSSSLYCSSRDTRIIWRSELIKSLTGLMSKPPPTELTHNIDGNEVEYNSNPNNYDIDGVVKSRTTGMTLEYPTIVVQFMEFLGRYPFSKKNEIVSEQNVCKIFATLVNRLGDLNAPLYPYEAAYLVDILTKHEHFAELLEMNRTRQWNAQQPIRNMHGEEYDGFSKELPVCGVRASMHRRKTISPAELHSGSLSSSSSSIQDESTYKIRESWLISAIQLVILTIPTARRRKLHKFIMFMRSISTNEVLELADISNGFSNNWEATVCGLWIGICGGFKKQQGIFVSAVLLANYRVIFAPHDDFYCNVKSIIPSEKNEIGRYSKVERGRKMTRNKDDPIYGTLNATPGTNKKNEQPRSFLNRLLKRS